MRARMGKLSARVLPHGPLDAVRQLALFAAAYYGYRLVRGAVDGRVTSSFEHARQLISFERSLHAFIEPAVQAWVSGKSWLIDFASWMYVNSHFTITLATLVFLYRWRNESFYFVRNMFMIAMGLALVGYLVYPTAPPRFMPEWGFRDSVSDFTHIPQQSAAVNAFFNPFAAVPSMHVAFALMIGWPMARLVRRRPLKVLWAVYPLVVAFVVVATGNHYWIDAVLGGMTAGVSALLAQRLLARARSVWAFAPAGAEATV